MKGYSSTKYKNGLLLWKIDRPEKWNAINFEVMDGLELMLDEAERDPSIKAVAITGEGERSFCSGGDVAEFHHLKTEEQAYSMLSRMGSLLYRLAVLPKPTVAVLNGVALGGGCELAAACDMRIAKAGTNAGFIQGSLAITTGWGGASLLFERMNPSLALQILTEAQLLSVQELSAYGFINQIYDGDTLHAVKKFTEQILSREADVLKSYKAALIEKIHKGSLKERMAQEIRRCALLWSKEEHHRAVTRFLKR
ncbi:MAG TPA: enoyl-CoA hydratase/isomerase family protein [Bacillus bacterium]|uniref:Short-chain-enoyl-CoA hydratase n=1 Tax=Siminovitchia fordii TaxID=254759 RepID=A0ABQ4JZS5_9BACI|nr:enoyl-CoA hydratase/isomerase family protein [Siminovitchia fordii]GIN19045.1 short-chain-enoyl-CoA hydratase [Siminovitchia fordii]HBZ10340.1 enoyl-CoA hydratase/isomerase family protein [Bacillus sp. (in: firmicutes)]